MSWILYDTNSFVDITIHLQLHHRLSLCKEKKERARPHESRHFSLRSSFRLQTERTSRITAKACPLRSLSNKLYPSLSTSRNIYDNFEENRTVELSFLDQLLSFLLNIDQLWNNNVVDPMVPVSGSRLQNCIISL